DSLPRILRALGKAAPGHPGPGAETDGREYSKRAIFSRPVQSSRHTQGCWQVCEGLVRLGLALGDVEISLAAAYFNRWEESCYSHQRSDQANRSRSRLQKLRRRVSARVTRRLWANS